MPGLASLGLSYAAGALSTLSPCVLPLLPIILLSVIERHKLGPAMLALGLVVSFTAVGVTIASLGFSIGLDASVLRAAVAVLLLAMGIVMLVPALQARLGAAAAPLATGGQNLIDRIQPKGLLGQLMLGALLGAVWSPCSGPTLGAAIGLASQGGGIAQATVIMLAFGLGAATPILVLAYGSRQAIFLRRDWLTRSSKWAKPVIGTTLAMIGLFILTGLDHTIETGLTEAMPDWLVAVTTRF
ncbi:MAG: cytochrome c biogenesis protein CcdA [Proteobacteria bacterium]|nr:cytochrome c biogenesis protein CcdA [Pseudomonadota bacterium]